MAVRQLVSDDARDNSIETQEQSHRLNHSHSKYDTKSNNEKEIIQHMETKKITFPNYPMELFRYYYPNSLQGQENSAENLIDIEVDVHTKITREGGIETCTCGLVFVNDSSGWREHYGHRNHKTGELQPVARVKAEYVSHRGVASVTTSYRCEHCGSNEISDPGFFSVKGPGSRRKNIHSCALDDLILAREEFQDARSYFHKRRFFFSPTPNSYYFETLGNVSVIVDSSGARLSGTGTHFQQAMLELLSNQSMLISESQERLEEISKSFSLGEVFDPWRVSDTRTNWLYRSNPGFINGPYGYIRFSSEEVKNLSCETLTWSDSNFNLNFFYDDTFTHKTVMFQMTKNHFIVYGDKLALPVAQVPVIGLGNSPDFVYLDSFVHNA